MPLRARVFERRDRWARLQLAAGEVADALTLLMMAGLMFLLADRVLPPQDLPWKPLRLAHPIGIATRPKVEHAAHDPVVCRAVLADGGLSYRDVPDQQSGFCQVRGALTLSGDGALLRPAGAVMVCEEALAYALWERQVVQPAALAAFGQPVTAIEHYGSYACRRRYGQRDTEVSEHAFANAVDIAAFRLADGRAISVERDWRSDEPEGAFLREVRDGGCRVFNGVLSPDYNQAHHDHLHLDMGRWVMCR